MESIPAHHSWAPTEDSTPGSPQGSSLWVSDAFRRKAQLPTSNATSTSNTSSDTASDTAIDKRVATTASQKQKPYLNSTGAAAVFDEVDVSDKLPVPDYDPSLVAESDGTVGAPSSTTVKHTAAGYTYSSPLHQYVLKIPFTSEFTGAITMGCKHPLDEGELRTLAEHIREIAELKEGSTNIEFAPEVIKHFGILEIFATPSDKIKKTNASKVQRFTPPKGLEFLSDTYKKIYIEGYTEQLLKETSENFYSLFHPDTKERRAARCPEISLVGMAEFIRQLESGVIVYNGKGFSLSEDQTSFLKKQLITLKELLDKKIPDQIQPLHQIADKFEANIHIDYKRWTPQVRGNPAILPFFVDYLNFQANDLGLNDVFTKRFANDLKECLEPLAKNRIEIAAGRGMLSASLTAVDLKVLYVSDIAPPPPDMHWPGINVKKKNAVDVIKTYKGQHMSCIYLCSWPHEAMISNLVQTNIPFFLLTTGVLQLVFMENITHKLKVIELNIPTYCGWAKESKVRFIAANVPKEDYQIMISRIPGKFRT